MQVLLPPGWPRPMGYANGVTAKGRMVFVAGMIGWDAQGVVHTDDMAGQVRQALQNIVDVLKEGGAKLVFQLAELARHGALCEVQLFGCARDAAGAGCGLKGEQVGQWGQKGAAQNGHAVGE